MSDLWHLLHTNSQFNLFIWSSCVLFLPFWTFEGENSAHRALLGSQSSSNLALVADNSVLFVLAPDSSQNLLSTLQFQMFQDSVGFFKLPSLLLLQTSVSIGMKILTSQNNKNVAIGVELLGTTK